MRQHRLTGKKIECEKYLAVFGKQLVKKSVSKNSRKKKK
jgi:hypothetical protein